MEFLKYYLLDIVFICIGIYLFCSSFHKIRHGDKENLFDLFKLNYKLYSITAMFLLLVFIPTCINFVYKFGMKYFILFYTNIKDTDMIGFYGDVLSFLGTVCLGALALWQNEKLNKENEKIRNQNAILEKADRLVKIKPNFEIVTHSNMDLRRIQTRIINSSAFDVNDIRLHINKELKLQQKNDIPINVKASDEIIHDFYFASETPAQKGKEYIVIVTCVDIDKNKYFYKYLFTFICPQWEIKKIQEITEEKFEQYVNTH